MTRIAHVASFVLLLYSAQPGRGLAQLPQSATPQTAVATPSPTLTLPAGTKLELALTRPIWAKTAKAGDPIYAEINFPTAAAGKIAIPAGTYVAGEIQAITRPTRKLSRAELSILLSKIVFANGYTVLLPAATVVPTIVTAAPASSNLTPPATKVEVTVEVRTSNDLLLDNGAQIEMTLAAPLALDAKQVALAIPMTRAPGPGSFKSATLCRPTSGFPGSPGTPDTVIPGTPGTPSITIPGGPGMPDTTIPGTPGTPSITIPGTPGTPDTPSTVCPAAPIVVSSVPIPPSPASSSNTASINTPTATPPSTTH